MNSSGSVLGLAQHAQRLNDGPMKQLTMNYNDLLPYLTEVNYLIECIKYKHSSRKASK